MNNVKSGKLNEKADLSIFKNYELLLVIEATDGMINGTASLSKYIGDYITDSIENINIILN